MTEKITRVKFEKGDKVQIKGSDIKGQVAEIRVALNGTFYLLEGFGGIIEGTQLEKIPD